jgi:hypothetical protein
MDDEGCKNLVPESRWTDRDFLMDASGVARCLHPCFRNVFEFHVETSCHEAHSHLGAWLRRIRRAAAGDIIMKNESYQQFWRWDKQTTNFVTMLHAAHRRHMNQISNN